MALVERASSPGRLALGRWLPGHLEAFAQKPCGYTELRIGSQGSLKKRFRVESISGTRTGPLAALQHKRFMVNQQPHYSNLALR